MHIFSGSSNRELAEKVALKLDSKLGASKATRFENGELRVVIDEPKVNKKALIIQSFSNPVDTNIIEFCLLTDAVKRMGATEITAVIPWLGYSKQDKVFRTGEPLSAKVIAKIVQTAPVKEVITFDLHNPAITGFFDVPVNNLSAKPLFVEFFKDRLSDDTVVVAPDAGAIKSSTSFAAGLGVPVVYIDKSRDLKTGKVSVLGISRSVEGKEVIIVDDMIVTGGTLVETAKFLKKQKVRSLSVAATHHLYVKGAQENIENAGFDTVVVTDTIKPKTDSINLQILSVAELIAETIKNSEE